MSIETRITITARSRKDGLINERRKTSKLDILFCAQHSFVYNAATFDVDMRECIRACRVDIEGYNSRMGLLKDPPF